MYRCLKRCSDAFTKSFAEDVSQDAKQAMFRAKQICGAGALHVGERDLVATRLDSSSAAGHRMVMIISLPVAIHFASDTGHQQLFVFAAQCGDMQR